jgi:hypothetical protein
MTDKNVWFIACTDAIDLAEQKVADLKEKIDAFCDLSRFLALNNLQPTGDRR